MSVNLEDIRNGLVTNLAAIVDCTKSAYPLANPTGPALMVLGFDVITPLTFDRGGFALPMLVQGVVGKPLDSAAHRRLDRWLSPDGDENVWAALEADRTLGGKCESLAVTSCDGSQRFVLDSGAEALGSTWHVLIYL